MFCFCRISRRYHYTSARDIDNDTNGAMQRLESPLTQRCGRLFALMCLQSPALTRVGANRLKKPIIAADRGVKRAA
jgi:hypothetical protein